jgi:hypothetical protein
VHGDAGEVVAAHFAFADVHTPAHVKPELTRASGDRLCAAHGTRRAVECREEAAGAGRPSGLLARDVRMARGSGLAPGQPRTSRSVSAK